MPLLKKEEATMRYQNAGKLLPEALLKEVQRYAAGEILYVPVPFAFGPNLMLQKPCECY